MRLSKKIKKYGQEAVQNLIEKAEIRKVQKAKGAYEKSYKRALKKGSKLIESTPLGNRLKKGAEKKAGRIAAKVDKKYNKFKAAESRALSKGVKKEVDLQPQYIINPGVSGAPSMVKVQRRGVRW